MARRPRAFRCNDLIESHLEQRTSLSGLAIVGTGLLQGTAIADGVAHSGTTKFNGQNTPVNAGGGWPVPSGAGLEDARVCSQ